jgi:hypothetical protein
MVAAHQRLHLGAQYFDTRCNCCKAYSHILTVDDIKHEIPDWDFVNNYGSNVLGLIQKTNDV